MTHALRRPAGVAHRIAGELRTRIGELPGGAVLPPMDVLGQQFHASVPTVRQALKILESEGRLTVRRGRHGGSVICDGKPPESFQAIENAMRAEHLTYWESAVALRCLMAACAGICASREDRAEAVIPTLRAVHRQTHRMVNATQGIWIRAEIQFHAELVNLCGNPALVSLARALEAMLISDPEFATEKHLVRLEPPPPRAQVLDEHADVIARIERGDRDGVVAHGQVHLLRTCGCLALQAAG